MYRDTIKLMTTSTEKADKSVRACWDMDVIVHDVQGES